MSRRKVLPSFFLSHSCFLCHDLSHGIWLRQKICDKYPTPDLLNKSITTNEKELLWSLPLTTNVNLVVINAGLAALWLGDCLETSDAADMGSNLTAVYWLVLNIGDTDRIRTSASA